MSSSGVVNVLPGDNNIAGDFEPEKSPHEQREVSRDCFYNMCERSSYWDGWVVCGTFKSRNSRLFCTFFTLMVISVFLAIIAPLALYSLADDSINSEVVIDSTSSANYESWSTNAYGSGFDDIKVKYDMYYFDIQNAEDVLNGAKPVVVEVGPYAYDEYFIKFDIEWSDGGDTIAYNTQKYYIFNQERTGPGLTQFDNLTLPYATVVGFEYLLSTLPPSVSQMADYILLGKLHAKHDVLAHNLSTIYDMVPKRPANIMDPIRLEIQQTNATLNMLFDRMYEFVAVSHTVDLLLKTLLCGTPSGISPFFVTNPSDAWFGWLNDPLLMEVQGIINMVNAKMPPEAQIPWTSAVPGASTNWTSIEETRRRRSRDVFKTGKKNKNQVAQYVQFNGMNTDNYHVCVSPMESQVPSEYVEGEQFPACAYYNNDWTEQEAHDAGYHRPFATPFANRVQGTDANMYGRPVRGEKIAVFVSDIYRSVFIENKGEVDWNGVPVRRYGIQLKDMLNSTANPENEQYYNYAPSGMENTTNAAGIPVFVSFPHFYLGDDRLVAAVKGLDPNDHRHETFIDIEPQTGLLARAEKKLQVNYLMESTKLPQTKPDTLNIAHGICANITEVEAAIMNSGQFNGTLPVLHCNSTLLDNLFTCLNAPSDWKFQDDAIFFPFGWAAEQMSLPDSAADDLNNSLFLIDDIAVQIRFWCLIIAGLCFAVLLSMLASQYLDTQERRKAHVDRAAKEGALTSASEPLITGSAPPAEKFSSFSA